MEQKIERLLGRLSQVEQQLLDPSIFSDQKVYKALTQEHSHLSEVKKTFDSLQKAENALRDNRELLKNESDPDFTEMLREEIVVLDQSIPLLQERLQELLVPPDPTDSRNTIVEIRAGTGGDEAAIFVGDVVRMYQFFANKMGWRCEMLSASPSELGGYKEAVMVLAGPDVYRFMKYEGGTHRVQRVPRTETQGRVHTSAITIAVLPEPDEDEDIVIDEKDLRIDTYRSSGAGGQHVNTTDSAVRITHIPTGVACYCQEERSQHKNKDKAMRLLKAKLVEEERRKKEAAISSQRSAQVGSGDRSERIRTYNFPQNRLTDHRIDLTLYNLSAIMDGELLP
ncbi:MAG: peptide chain release factor 1, partial [Chlamydiota bacterium]